MARRATARAILAALALALALVVAAHAAAPRPSLRLGVSVADWSALDPQTGTFDAVAWSLLHATCTTLVTYPDRAGPKGGLLIPDGATSFPRISADGRTYTFTIRRDLRFSDGTNLTAANYARAIGRLLDPALYSDVVQYAQGIAAVHGHGRTLTIHLNHADGDLLERLALPVFCPVPTNYPVDPAGVTLTVGSGPYRVASMTAFRGVTLLPNRFYRGPRRQPFASITLTIGGSPESLEAQVAAGTLDYSYDGVPSALAPSVVRRYGVGQGTLFYKPFPGLFYLQMNLQSPLFKDNLQLRRAVENAIDRAEVVREIAPFDGRRAGQLIPTGVPGHSAQDVFPLAGANLREARKLARGHLRSGHLTFYTFASPEYARFAGLVAYNLRQIGLRVDVRTFAARVEFAKLKQPGEPWDLGTGIWYADYADASQFVTPIVGPQGFSPVRTPGFVRKLRAASRLTGPARTRAFADLAQWTLRTQAPVVPLFTVTRLAMVSPRLSCVSFNTMTELNLSSVCLRPS